MATIVYRGTRQQLISDLSKIPGMLAGRIPDRFGVAASIQRRIGNALLKEIRIDYDIKNKGGTGRDGITWPELAPATLKKKKAKGTEKKGIMRDEDEIYESLRPGIEDRPSGARGQIFEVTPGRITLSSAVRHFKEHFHATKYRPARPVWPDVLPDPWMQGVALAVGEGITRTILMLVTMRARL